MKVCIISTAAPRNMAMYSIYTDYFSNSGIPYDLVYFDKYAGTDNTSANQVFRFDAKSAANSRIKRYFDYIRFISFTNAILAKHDYDYLVVWNELTASLMCSTLSKTYKNKYCVNIRDLFDERNLLLYNAMERRLRKSLLNCHFATLSSKKYMEYLPPMKYMIFHSVNEHIVPKKKHKLSRLMPIRIMFIGNIRFYSNVIRFVDLIKNDKRFEFIIAGNGGEELREFCKKKSYTNIKFIDTFENNETARIIEEADMLFNLYGTEYACLRTALSQKMYLAISLRIPILVYKNTYMFEFAEKCGLAFGVDDTKIFSDSIKDDLIEWYTNLDEDTINNKCCVVENEISKVNQEFKDYIATAIPNG